MYLLRHAVNKAWPVLWAPLDWPSLFPQVDEEKTEETYLQRHFCSQKDGRRQYCYIAMELSLSARPAAAGDAHIDGKQQIHAIPVEKFSAKVPEPCRPALNQAHTIFSWAERFGQSKSACIRHHIQERLDLQKCA
jgi:hypothetical protein